jgi:hypothetical protein
MTKQVLAVVLWTISAGLLATVLCAAEPAGVSTEEQTITEELKGITDATILNRRIWLETEWNKYKAGRSDVEETLGGLWSWRVSANQDWAVRLKLPYQWHNAGDAADDSDNQGLGDIKVAAGTAFRLSKSWRLGGGLEIRMPTADEELSENVWQIKEIGSVAWDVTRCLTLSPLAEYNQSVAELHGASSQHYLEMFLPATFLLPHQWAVTPSYEVKMNFEDDNYVTHAAKLLVAKQLDDPPIGFALSIKRSFDSGEQEFQINFAITYYFRLMEQR